LLGIASDKDHVDEILRQVWLVCELW
jgi:hypothetical protein